LLIDAHVNLREQGSPGRPALGAEDLLREMDGAQVDRAVVVPCPGLATNRHVQEACARHADRLFALYNPDFADPARTVSELERSIRDQPVHGVKVHPRLQNVRPSDPVVGETVACAAAHGLPVLFDCFPHGDSLDDPDRDPLAYLSLARRFPEATLVLAHAGGHRALQAFMLATACPNVVLEASFTLAYLEGSSAERDVVFAVRRLVPGRTLYGSDFPEVELGGYLRLTRRLLGEMDAARSQAFFASTARSVYRLPV
jgi:predicted TIM-barrel fold metal-dependent hydrolase